MSSEFFDLESPRWIALLALLPVIWIAGRGSIAGLGRARGVVATGMRSLVITAVVLALAGAQWRHTSDRMTVIYLLDQSLSIPEPHRQAMLDYVREVVDSHRRADKEDRVGVVVFGKEAEIEYPPVDYTPPLDRIESVLDRRFTNLAGAFERAMSLFPQDSAKRIVVVTDGNENLGKAWEWAEMMADAGVSIDVLPAPVSVGADTSIEKLAAPALTRRGQPFDLRVVLNHRTPANSPSSGKLRVTRRAGGVETLVSEAAVELQPGKTVFSIRQDAQESDFYTYEARFLPDDPGQDRFSQNNSATGFTHVRGRGRVLLIEDWEQPGQFDFLVERLRVEGLQVEVQPSNQLFSSLAELQRYDTVLLANVPRTSGSDAQSVSAFTDDQIRMLVENTERLGCGLIMLGGRSSFGVGGWTNTELEKAMPIDFRVKNARVIPVGALAIVLDKSGSMQGQKIQLAKAAAIAAIRTLGPRDFATVVAFDTTPYDVAPLQRVGNARQAAARVDRLGAGGGTDLYPGMAQAFRALERADASLKHMIVLTDGQTPDNDFTTMVARMRARNITVSAVAVGPDAARPLLSAIASQGGGKFYAVVSPNAIPRIFMNEARRVATPLIRELDPPVAPRLVANHEITKGIDEGFPPLGGYVQSTVKESGLVDVILQSPVPAIAENSTILATWTYGLGKTAAFTADAGAEWANAWTGWSNYDRFFSQLVRWSMRPDDGGGEYQVATEVRDAKTRVIVDAIDKNDAFINSQSMTGFIVGPDLDSEALSIEQVAPGRYVGEFDSAAPGSYLITLAPGAGRSLLRTGVNIGYSAEYSDRTTNYALLSSMAGLTEGDTPPGKIITAEARAALGPGSPSAALLTIDPFRRDLPLVASSEPMWPLLVLCASCLFFGDVFVRRVQVSTEPIQRAWERLGARWTTGAKQAGEAAGMARLRKRREQVRAQLEVRKSAARFDYEENLSVQTQTSRPASSSDATPPSAPPTGASDRDEPPGVEGDGFTSRLLKAKRDVWTDRDHKK